MQYFLNRYVNSYRVIDLLTKVALLLVVLYANVFAYTYWQENDFEKNTMDIARLQKQLRRDKALAQQDADERYHVTDQVKVSNEKLHAILRTGLSTIQNVDIMATQITPISAEESGLVSFTAYPLQVYEVNVVLQGSFRDIENFYTSVQNSFEGEVFWKEMIFDAGDYPRGKGAIGFYVFAQD